MKHYLTTNNTKGTEGFLATQRLGKVQWLSYTRPEYCILHKRTSPRPHSTYRTFTKESQTSTTLLARHQALQIHHRTNSNTNNILDLDVHVDADWAGRPTTKKPTSGFNIIFLGTTIAFGSRTQATIALSSAESELYARGTTPQKLPT